MSRRRVLGAALAIGGLLANAFIVFASTPVWTMVSAPGPMAPDDFLSSISCSSTTACTAVGYNVSKAGKVVTLAERWNGTNWSSQSTPNPSGVGIGIMNGVSCASATACVAVGISQPPQQWSVSTLGETWNGTAWTLKAPQNPNPGISGLQAVSCAAANSCTAVGFTFDNVGDRVTLAELWNGASWTTQSTPNPSGATQSQLNGISCTSVTACTAVGYSGNSPLAEAWNGSVWTLQTVPSPAGAADASLAGVACMSSTACTAVGTYDDASSTSLTLAELWNGSAWNVQTTPNPAGTNSRVTLRSVSCPSASLCNAVGSYLTSAYAIAALAESWNGSTWTIQTTPKPSGAMLWGISCASTTNCMSAGQKATSKGQSALAETWNGTSWTMLGASTKSGAVYTVLNAVSCASSTACKAVGSTQFHLFAESFGGTGWSIETLPSPAGVIGSGLNGVSCTTATACIAVGSSNTSVPSTLTLAEAWNGTAWSVQSTPNPSGALTSMFTGISCASGSACEAVGTTSGLSFWNALAEAWNGASWNVQPVPSPAGGSMATLNGVSCTSATACIAVGNYYDGSGNQLTLAESWNGSVWTVQSTPDVNGVNNSLASISCAGPTACIAVGSTFNSSTITSSTLAESWNGTTWSMQSMPGLNGASDSILNAVSCTSATGCSAVGEYIPLVNSTWTTLAEFWNGTSWTAESSAQVKGATNNLSGVACTSGTACTAVGDYGYTFDFSLQGKGLLITSVPLIETHA